MVHDGMRFEKQASFCHVLQQQLIVVPRVLFCELKPLSDLRTLYTNSKDVLIVQGLQSLLLRGFWSALNGIKGENCDLRAP